jgi:hypothetical protein
VSVGVKRAEHFEKDKVFKPLEISGGDLKHLHAKDNMNFKTTKVDRDN